jgi:PAS domain S-box-containing protein/putative nucleotidyltransferase with HDIG domain
MEATLLGAIPHAVFGLNQRSVIFVNDEVKKVFGWKPEELIGKTTRVLYKSKKEYEDIGRRMYPALQKQGTYSGEFPCRKKDGSDIVCKVSASLLNPGTNDSEAVVIYEDITDKKRIEDALLRSEQKYLDLYQNAPDGYHSIGPDGTILEVNSTWLNMLGYPQEEVVNRMKLTDLLSEQERKIFKKTFPVLQEKGSIDNIEYKFRKKDGSQLPVLLRATAIYDAKGKFLKTRTIVRDISARESYKSMLEQTVEEWRITFDSMPYGVLMLNMDFSIIRANKYFSSLYKIPFTELKDKKCYEIIKSERLRKSMQDVITRKTISLESFEYHDKRKGRNFMLYLTPIPGSEGLTKSFVLALMDISELKDKEKKLTESRDAFFNMLKELDFSFRELKGLHEGLIHSFVNAIDEKSPWTKGHSERVTNYAVAIAKELGLAEDVIEELRIAALLHDIGKIGTYDIILDNPNKLTSKEVSLINLHPVKGERILQPLKQLKNILPVVRHHHERIDGRGYPDGLEGEKIPLLARILCIADSFDSMTSDRPYRSAGTREYAISELKRCSNTQFDAKAVDAFLRLLRTA